MDSKKKWTVNDEVVSEQWTASKGESWSRGTNSRLPFDVNVMLNLSNYSYSAT